VPAGPPAWRRWACGGKAIRTVHDRLDGGAGRAADQGAMWDEVAAYATRHRVDTATGALEDVHLARAADVERLVGGTRPTDGQRGVVATAGGRVLGLDLFDRPGTLARYWTAVTGAYALHALGSAGTESADSDEVAYNAVDLFLRRVLDAGATPVAGVGHGEELHLRTDGVDGHALVWDGAVIHLAAFPSARAAG
jgi:hypothetical protein